MHGFVIFTHDLDFGTLLAKSGARAPSLIQVRTQDVSPNVLGSNLNLLLQQGEATNLLKQGALVTVDEERHRIRMLPLLRS